MASLYFPDGQLKKNFGLEFTKSKKDKKDKKQEEKWRETCIFFLLYFVCSSAGRCGCSRVGTRGAGRRRGQTAASAIKAGFTADARGSRSGAILARAVARGAGEREKEEEEGKLNERNN